ncbi:hypothetical protein A79_4782 [Vibrio parahaemolyticus AQ3810]|nr:hypothetical protein VPUCM_2087 [Vibrio parahaemolyticus UCM-V493]EDM59662.1 hypothetical protein A79_4782 [Vibrio parahaemolyticus AQ3810]EFO39988.1 conserved hypothetical protein [Vibrio parahaemolyticus AN-5034]EQM03262.1 hypothetical protein D019_3314 [Vibrio parahaemolyticus VP2007-095]EQM10391.1 hypothetical protein D045_3227 [Vibrio parahaemolyticus VP-NY4]ETS21427.1 hypothetical protein D033_2846 [Vibrio parahaemolyticus B-265]ETT10729.1 hypothetical protein D026_2452 [Vibrio parah
MGAVLSALSITKGIVDFHIFRGCEELLNGSSSGLVVY